MRGLSAAPKGDVNPTLRATLMIVALCLSGRGCSVIDKMLYKTPQEQCLSNPSDSKTTQLHCLCQRIGRDAGVYAYYFERRDIPGNKLREFKDDRVVQAYDEFKLTYATIDDFLSTLNSELSSKEEVNYEELRQILGEMRSRVESSHKNRLQLGGIGTGGARPVEKLRQELRRILDAQTTQP